MFSTRSGAAKLALAIVIGLVAIKVTVAVLGGSISIAAQAVDSFLDLFAISVTIFAVAMASCRLMRNIPSVMAKWRALLPRYRQG